MHANTDKSAERRGFASADCLREAGARLEHCNADLRAEIDAYTRGSLPSAIKALPKTMASVRSAVDRFIEFVRKT